MFNTTTGLFESSNNTGTGVSSIEVDSLVIPTGVDLAQIESLGSKNIITDNERNAITANSQAVLAINNRIAPISYQVLSNELYVNSDVLLQDPNNAGTKYDLTCDDISADDIQCDDLTADAIICNSIESNGVNLNSAISVNTGNISTNTQNISTNSQNISTNSQNISTNSQNISTNSQNISTNTNNINTNTAGISTNLQSITALNFSVSALQGTTTYNSRRQLAQTQIPVYENTSQTSNTDLTTSGNSNSDFELKTQLFDIEIDNQSTQLTKNYYVPTNIGNKRIVNLQFIYKEVTGSLYRLYPPEYLKYYNSSASSGQQSRILIENIPPSLDIEGILSIEYIN